MLDGLRQGRSISDPDRIVNMTLYLLLGYSEVDGSRGGSMLMMVLVCH